ncbi:MAG TPA: AP endonuclease [Prolixibacteraceae bacterium]|nr:AP endonuclease [Prolixibacteraceae bacterium]
MKTIKGPAIFLAQFIRDQAPFNNLDGITSWVADLGYKGIQLPSWDARLIDLKLAATSKTYCDELKGKVESKGLFLVELAAYLQGQVIAIHPAYETMFDAFYPGELTPRARTEWATDQLMMTIKASANFSTKNISVLSGGFAWHTMYPWPQRPDGLIHEAFAELVARWMPVLNFAWENDITIGYELHPGSDLFDGATYEMFLEMSGNHPAACIAYDPSHMLLQQMDYIQFIEIFAEKIKAFHVKDAEFNPTGRVGVYGGYQPWVNRAGRFRSLGDGQVDFKRIFSLLTEKNYDGWAILEWEDCLKSPQQGAAEGAPFIKQQIINATEVSFDDFAGKLTTNDRNRKILGISD